jgi:S-sulfo-L-cysteine synthase (3-phospho-L-serine-dependent)
MRGIFLFVESNTTGSGRNFLRSAALLGYRPILLAADPKRYEHSGFDPVEVVEADTSSVGTLEAVVRTLCRDGAELVAITSSSDYYVGIAATLARIFELHGPSPQAIQTCQDKNRQRAILREAGVDVPDWRRIDSVTAALEFARLHALIVAKPVSGSGSVGVRLCRTRRELADHVAELLQRRTNERGLPIPPGALVEAFVSGDEYSVECFGGDPLVVTRKWLGSPPYFVEIGHDVPATLESVEREAIAATAARAVSVLGLTQGPTHVEIRAAAAGPAVIEVNPRLAGGQIPKLVQLACGIDLVEATLASAAGSQQTLAPTQHRHAAIRFFLVGSAPRGPIRRTFESRLDGDRAHVEVEVFERASDRPRHDFRDRVGHAIAWGDTALVSRHAERAVAGQTRGASEPAYSV